MTREEQLRAMYGSRSKEWIEIARDMASSGCHELALAALRMSEQAAREDEIRDNGLAAVIIMGMREFGT